MASIWLGDSKVFTNFCYEVVVYFFVAGDSGSLFSYGDLHTLHGWHSIAENCSRSFEVANYFFSFQAVISPSSSFIISIPFKSSSAN